ncbi:MAG TPA: aldehyde dehydrogenase family protein [Candidatus Limnocylindria bacterium]|nr:aldehyde dehydrogenase family protein [Candidatus Limnocylindria bacterium]
MAVPKRPGASKARAGRASASKAVARAVRSRVPATSASRIDVRKTYKLYIGGAFPRSESGRSYVVAAADGTPLTNAVRGSRKDLRDAVRAARGAFQPWADRTAMNRGQVLYRVAELMEGRRHQFEAEVAEAEGVRADKAREIVARSIDRWVWYAGWADKIAQVLGSSNPVAADYFNFTIPEPTGVVGIVAPETSSLLGLVSRLVPPLVAGNSVVVLASESRPLPAISLTEVLATSDVPGGVINVITGRKRELVPVLAAHEDVDSLDVWGVPEDLRVDVELSAADSIKRVARRPEGVTDARFDWLDDRASERPEWIAAYLEMKTVWHPIGV